MQAFKVAVGELDDQNQAYPSLLTEKLGQARGELRRALGHLQQFCLEADLSALDQGLAACRQADYLLREVEALHQRLGSPLPLPEVLGRSLGGPAPLPDFQLHVTRQAGVSRALFSCPICGWEFSYAAETEATDFLEIPLSDFTCPLCEEAAENTSSGGRPPDDNPRTESVP